ncbi:MAG TPA: heme biosynthesis HemY N-terminal domain-containing protein [Vitreimonas sp.]|uniref:heme biosynthesis protein HemY n=1 Tax=Vitreimonas sp. TaxID=3069702 RepID=UPI002D6811B0|nr:heme biosynthesis HemY N-terminal domain-containing protein [Vitreimonas sp.]HYD89765.1 heme biosynthesis HemY N-terminal domain-containing protein [Vitreimonas sp.]
MLRVAFLLIVAVVAMLASWQIVTTDPGTVEVEWFGTQVSTTALFGLLILVAIIAVALPLLRLVMFLMDAPGRIGKASQRARVRRGQEALALGLIAAEAGEFEDARRHADKAEDLIDEPRLALLLQARAAEVSGDTAAAERAYSGMLQNEDTEVLGRKGLMAAALKRGDRTAARAHAEAALKASKTATWPFQYAFDLAVQAADWENAIEALDLGDKRKQVEDKVAKRRRAVLMCAQSAKLERERRADKACEMAQKAFRMAPTFAPAAAITARMLVAEGRAERAAAILEEAWENAPHPALAHAYRDIVPGETREARAERMRAFAEKRRDHRESKIVLAELAMERGDWGGAQAALEDAYRENPSSRICILFAQVARGRGDENGARTWLAQAAAAPREADWSDLDPEGPAFLYDDSDWARMVYVFGDSGQLIHPRMERGGVDALGPVLALPTAVLTPPRPDARVDMNAPDEVEVEEVR